QVLPGQEQVAAAVEVRLETVLVRQDRAGVAVAGEPDDVLESGHVLGRQVGIGVEVPDGERDAGRGQCGRVVGLDVWGVAVVVDQQRVRGDGDRLHGARGAQRRAAD